MELFVEMTILIRLVSDITISVFCRLYDRTVCLCVVKKVFWLIQFQL